jgi:hypothetical protein
VDADGWWSSLVVDAAGAVHAAYFATGDASVRYATNASGAWVAETVGTNAILGVGSRPVTLALASDGSVHVAWNDDVNDLRFATNTSGAWVTEVLDSDGSTGVSPNLVIDAGGADHIAYTNVSDLELRHATNASGAWTIETLDLAYEWTSLAQDAAGHLHIAYFDPFADSVRYATDASGAWTFATVDAPAGGAGYYVSIALDAGGAPVVAYERGGWDHLAVATLPLADGVDNDCDGIAR